MNNFYNMTNLFYQMPFYYKFIEEHNLTPENNLVLEYTQKLVFFNTCFYEIFIMCDGHLIVKNVITYC